MLTIESFGYLHAVPQGDGLVIDLRERLRDPHVDPRMREMTGLDDAVFRHVLATPGAADLVAEVVDQVLDMHGLMTRVFIGCQGGRHRSVVVAREVSRRLGLRGIEHELIHHHVHRPVVER